MLREGRTIWILEAHCDNGKRFVVRAEEKLTLVLELNRQSGFAAIALDEHLRFLQNSDR
jgi:hypothetical protein